MREYAEYRLKAKIETAAGVAAVRLAGGLVPEVQVLADRARLVAFGVDLGTMVDRIEAANVNSPAGEIKFKGLEIPVRTVGRFTKPDQVLEVPLNQDDARQGREMPGALVTVAEVARVIRTHKDRTGFCLADNKPAVLLSILKEPEGNTVKVSQAVRKLRDELSPTLPHGWDLAVVDDQAPFISQSLSSLGQMVVYGGLLAFVVLWVYLRRLARAMLVVLAAPVALAATMGFMRLFGVGLNLMSIGGLALGVGMLVDGSIVVLEAFLRHRDQGEDPDRAAVNALSEVRGGLICGAAATTVVLVPIMFLTGLAQRLFTDFAFTLIVSLAISLATAVWLLPALLVWRPGKPDQKQGGRAGKGFLARSYGRLLGVALKIYPLTVLAGLVLAAGAGWMLYHSGASLLPELSEGKALVRITLPTGSGMEIMEAAVKRLVGVMGQTPGLKSSVVRAGVDPGGSNTPGLEQGKPNQAFVTAIFDPQLWRKQGAEQSLGALREKLRGEAAKSPGLLVDVIPAGDLATPGKEAFSPPQLLILTGEELGPLRKAGEKIVRRLSSLEELSALQAQGSEMVRQLNVQVDRRAAALKGITVLKVARTVSRAIQGQVAGKLLEGDYQTDIRVRLRKEDRKSFGDLSLLPISIQGGGFLTLARAASLRAGRGPEEMLRFERRPAIIIRGQVTKGSFSQGQAKALAAASGVKLPKGAELQPGSAHAALAQSLETLAGALLLALGLTYVILVIRFESLRWPLVIILGLTPLAMGPALALKIWHMPLSSLVLLGSVVLLGMAANGSILLIELANSYRIRGSDVSQALIQAARIRLKPLVMSLLTTILGALPLCLGLGGGAAISRPLALTVVSGLVVSCFSTMFMVPALYRLFAPRAKKGA